MEFTRSHKVSRLIQKDLSEIFLSESKIHFKGLLITVTHVFISKECLWMEVWDMNLDISISSQIPSPSCC